MRRVEGSAGVSLMECTNPVKDKWRIRWDVQEKENGSASYMEEEFGHKPTDEEIRTLVMSWYNSQTDAAILSGFAYNGAPVWLSTENQYNYKAAYDLAVHPVATCSDRHPLFLLRYKEVYPHPAMYQGTIHLHPVECALRSPHQVLPATLSGGENWKQV